MTETTLPEKRTSKPTLKQMLVGDEFKHAIAAVLPKHLTADRFVRVAITATIRTPLLAQCDQHSFFNCLMRLSQYGLEPDGYRAHLIPFRNNKRGVVECQLIIDYKGLVELAMRSGTVANIHADVVCENDTFDYDRGELRSHKIDFRKPRGPVYAAYARCRFKDLTEKVEVMSRDEIESIRARSRAAQNGPWNTDWNEMAKKTVFRRLSKWLTLSPEFRDAVEAEDAAEAVIAKTAGPTVPMFEIPAPSLPEPATPVFEPIPEPAKEKPEDDLNYDLGQTEEVAPPAAPATPSPAKADAKAAFVAWWVVEMKRTFDQFQEIAVAVGDPNAANWTCFDDIHGQTMRKYNNARPGLNAEFASRFGAKPTVGEESEK